jgi:hypothetical protein
MSLVEGRRWASGRAMPQDYHARYRGRGTGYQHTQVTARGDQVATCGQPACHLAVWRDHWMAQRRGRVWHRAMVRAIPASRVIA